MKPFDRTLVPVVFAFALMSDAARTQNLDSAQLGEMTVEELAQSLLNGNGADLVAVGRFAAHVERGDDLMSSLGPSTEVTVSFQIDRVYKGAAPRGQTVNIRLQSDMLAFPGKAISRNSERTKELEARHEQMKAIGEESKAREERLRSGQLSRADYQRELRDSDARHSLFTGETVELVRAARHVGSSHVSSFYDRGGAILPGTEYLIAVNGVDGDPRGYVLGEIGFGIMWGELADAVQADFAGDREPATGAVRQGVGRQR